MSGNNVILFEKMEKGTLAQYAADPMFKEFAQTVADDVSYFATYPVISIKGKVWTTVVNGERNVMMKPPPNQDEVVSALELVIIRANDKARTYYDSGFKEGGEDDSRKPTCYSNDGLRPSDRSTEKQSPQCPTCRWAAFGTALKQDGTPGKGTRCAQNARLAVAAIDGLDKPHLIRVPPTSLKPLREAIEVIRKRNIAYPVVLMKVSFVPEEASPMLRFVPFGLLEKDAALRSIQMRDDGIVRAICGLDDLSVEAPPAQAQATAPADPLAGALDAAIAARAASVPARQPVAGTPSPAPANQAAATPSSPAAVTTPPAPPPTQAEPAVTVVKDAGLMGDLGDILSRLDG